MNTFRPHLRRLLIASGLAITAQWANAHKGGGGTLMDSVKAKPVIFSPPNTGLKKAGSGRTSPVRTQAQGVATIANGQVTGVKITEKGYFREEVQLEVVFSGGGGTGAAGRVNLRRWDVMIMDYGYSTSWTVKEVQITNPGSGYTSPPTVTFVLKP